MSVGEAIGGFFSGIAKVLTGGVVEKGMEIINKIVPDKDLRDRLEAEFRTTQFITEASLEHAKLASETQIQLAQEVTHQAELNQSDLYTKQTRPKIARQSWYVSSGYAFICFSSDFIIRMVQTFSHPVERATLEWLHSLQGVQFHAEIYVAAAAPALAYMGVRSLDIWRAGGAKRV